MRINIGVMGALLLTVGCGGGEADGDKAGENMASTAVGSSETGDQADASSGSEVALAAVDCKQVKGQTAPEGEPADDILGIRPGMGLREVRALLMCKDPDYAFNSRQNEIKLSDGPVDATVSHLTLDADTGLEKLQISFLGPAGQEEVVHVSRRVEYVEGKELPVASLKQELASKYGDFDEPSYPSNRGFIIRARGGQRLSKSNSSYKNCDRHHISWSWSPNSLVPCGDVISYEIDANRENEDLAMAFSVAVTDYVKATQMKSASLAAAQNQKAAELKQAEKTAAGEDLEL